jgi:hypothetical protein
VGISAQSFICVLSAREKEGDAPNHKTMRRLLIIFPFENPLLPHARFGQPQSHFFQHSIAFIARRLTIEATATLLTWVLDYPRLSSILQLMALRQFRKVYLLLV